MSEHVGRLTDDEVEVAVITVRSVINADGDMVYRVSNPKVVSVIEQIGLLRYAEHIIMQDEWPD